MTYYVKELDTPEGYISKVSQDGNVFTVTNTEAVKVPVTKEWSGKKLDSVKVKLLADGKQVSEAELNEAGGWKYEFTDLTKYNTDKTEIVYTVEEVIPEGYEATVTGNAKDGFVITNTQKTTVPPETDKSKKKSTKKSTTSKSNKNTKTVKAEQTVTKSPETGDYANIGLWMFLGIFASGGMAVTAVMCRKRRG